MKNFFNEIRAAVVGHPRVREKLIIKFIVGLFLFMGALGNLSALFEVSSIYIQTILLASGAAFICWSIRTIGTAMYESSLYGKKVILHLNEGGSEPLPPSGCI